MEKNKIVRPIREIAFFDAKEYDKKSFDEVNKKFGYRINYHSDKISLTNLPLLGDANVVCAFVNGDLDKTVLSRLVDNGVELLAMRCAGFNNVDFEYACANGLPVVRVPAYSPYAVAEYALGMILTLNRKTHRAYLRVKENNFSINGLMGFDLRGKTIGVVGTGRIGQVFCKLLAGFGMRILAYDLYPNDELRAAGVEYVDLETLYKESHIISLHCPLTPDSRHMINDRAIKMMRRDVMIINTSRGGLINAKSLIHGLKHGYIGAAGLDVYEEEADYFFKDLSDTFVSDDLLARLASFGNVLITSHQAFFTAEAMENIAHTTLSNIREFELGKPLTNTVCLKR